MAKIPVLTLLPPAIFAGLAGMFWWSNQNSGDDQLPSAFIGRTAPEVVVAPLGDGPGFSDADLRQGEVTLVNFWASWCGPCRVEHPNLQALADEGYRVYGVNYKDNPGNALGFLEELGSPYAGMGADPTGMQTAVNWGVYGIPETFVVDGDGNVLFRFAGPVTKRVIESDLRPLLDARPGPGS